MVTDSTQKSFKNVEETRCFSVDFADFNQLFIMRIFFPNILLAMIKY